MLSIWAASAAVLVAVTGGAASLLTAGFVVVIAQCIALRRAWVPEAGAAAVLAYAAAAAIAANRGALRADLGGWPQMMVVAYLAFSAGLAAGPRQILRARVDRHIAELAHDLRTPLTHILGFSELIERQVFGPLQEKYVEYARLIRASGEHLLELANAMLDLSSLDAGRYVLKAERFDAREVVGEIVRASAPAADAKAISLQAALPDQALWVRADRRALARIVLNILGNAIKFTPESGRIEVRARSQDAALVVEVADSGPGISAADKARLGRPFERGDSARNIEGFGLGLSIVKGLAAAHGGRLEFDEAPGGGALVRVTLPVVASE